MAFVGGALLFPDAVASTKATRPASEAMEVHMRLRPSPNWVLDVGWPFEYLEGSSISLFGKTSCKRINSFLSEQSISKLTEKKTSLAFGSSDLFLREV